MKLITFKNTNNKKNIRRILYIESNLDGTIGGSHYCLLELVKYINKSKFESFVLFYEKNSLIPLFEDNCSVILLDKTKGLVIERDFTTLYKFAKKFYPILITLIFCQKVYNFIRYLADFYEIFLILTRYKIDLIHLNNGPALTEWLLAAKILKIKCIGHLRGNWKIGYLHKKLVRFYDAIIAISQSVTNFVKARGANTDNFVIIHDGIDVENVYKSKRKTSEEIKKSILFSNSDFLFGVIGNLKPWKGQHVAIKAIALLKEKYTKIKCLIIGDVSNLEKEQRYFNYLKELVDRNELSRHVVFTGFRYDIPDIISVLNILVHTSVAPEPFGRVILEGMVFSKPVIATAHGGPLEIIEDGTSGFLVPPDDPIALTQKIDYLIAHPDIAKKVGQTARKRVEEYFNIYKNVKETELLYTRLLDIS